MSERIVVITGSVGRVSSPTWAGDARSVGGS
jgi:hypothetical protein